MLRTFLVAALTIAAWTPSVALAETLTWQVRSFHPKVVDIKFYSQNRKIVWPGNSTVYTIKNYDVQTYKLSCVAGEKICYGAWVRNTNSSYWGSGNGGKKACKSCCYTCDGSQTPIVNLNQ